MKISKLIIATAIVFSANNAFSQNKNNSSEQNNIENNVKFHSNGQVRSISNLSKSNEGDVTININLDTSGRITSQNQSLNKKKNGKQISYERGKISKIEIYKNGLLNGATETYASNRKLSSTEMYKNGIKDGVSKWFYYSGQLASEYNYTNGNIVGDVKYYHETIKQTKKGSKRGSVKTKDPLKVKSEYKFSNNEINGEYKEYNYNGTVVILGKYVDGKKHGKWKYFNDAGKQINTIKYKKGKKK